MHNASPAFRDFASLPEAELSRAKSFELIKSVDHHPEGAEAKVIRKLQRTDLRFALSQLESSLTISKLLRQFCENAAFFHRLSHRNRNQFLMINITARSLTVLTYITCLLVSQ